jgi:CheY-like chemotaxis protein
MENQNESMAEDSSLLVEKINTELKRLFGDNYRFLIKELPKISPEIKEILKNEKILMVDDNNFLLSSYLPYLMAATDTDSLGLFCVGKDMFEITKEIQEIEPSLILMDYNMNDSFNGTDIVMRLRRNFPGKIIGFSSDPLNEQKFKKSGADDFIHKNDDPEYALSELAKIVKNKKQ